MTPAEAAERIVADPHAIAEDICRNIYGLDESNWPNGLCNSISAALTAAVVAERTECAKVVEALLYVDENTGDWAVLTDADIAAAIRARGA